MLVGWLAVVILVVSFSYNGIFEIEPTEENAVPKNRPSKKGEMTFQHTILPHVPQNPQQHGSYLHK
jgi:hypothetical protein